MALTELHVTVDTKLAIEYLESFKPAIMLLKNAGLLDEDDIEKLKYEVHRRLRVSIPEKNE